MGGDFGWWGIVVAIVGGDVVNVVSGAKWW